MPHNRRMYRGDNEVYMIRTEQLSHVYQPGSPFEKKAVSDISIHIKKGEFVGIIGHTGSGKSTLIQHFNALEKATSGKIYIDGVDLSAPKLNLREIRRKVGVVFQYPEHQLMEETVRKDIAFGPKNMGLSTGEIDDRVIEAAKMIGLKDELLDKSPFDLSGGEKRRVAIAGVLAMRPQVLVLDEPTAGLDPVGRDDLLKLVGKMNSEGMTIVLVSHSMEDIAKTVQRVIVMNEGGIAMEGSVAHVFARRDELLAMGLNVPQISTLMAKLRDAGVNIPTDVYTIDQAKQVILKMFRKAWQD